MSEAATEKVMCQHCGERVANRPRRLCWSHYYDPAVRAQYEDGKASLLKPQAPLTEPVPTRTWPGGLPRRIILAARAAANQRLWHPLDATGVEMGRGEELAARAEIDRLRRLENNKFRKYGGADDDNC